jgi:hypothetical protein
MSAPLTSFISGVVFAIGLGIGGMTQPAKIIGFLDFAGDWDPSLIFVMLGAIGVHSILYHMFRGRLSAKRLLVVYLPSRQKIEPRLIGGAVIFGLGWGLAGYCPGPALTSLASGKFAVVIFSAGMIAGIVAFDLKEILSLRRKRAENVTSGIVQDM